MPQLWGFPSSSQQRPTVSTTCLPPLSPAPPLGSVTCHALSFPYSLIPTTSFLPSKPQILPLGSGASAQQTTHSSIPCRIDKQTQYPASHQGRLCLHGWENCQQTTFSCLSVPLGTVLAAESCLAQGHALQDMPRLMIVSQGSIQITILVQCRKILMDPFCSRVHHG